MSFSDFLRVLSAILFFIAAFIVWPDKAMSCVFAAIGCLILSGYKFPAFTSE